MKNELASNKDNAMSDFMLKLILLLKQSTIPQLTIPSGVGGVAIFLLGINDWSTELKVLIGMGVIVVVLIAAIITNWVKLRLGTKQLDITQSANTSDASIKMLNTISELIKAEVKERDEFWSKRIDFIREKDKEALLEVIALHDKALEEKEKIWLTKYDEIREEKHRVASECTIVTIKYGVLKNLISHRGHLINETDKSLDVSWAEERKDE